MTRQPDGRRGIARSLALYAQAEKRIPGGTQLVSRRPTRFAYGVSPIYAQRAAGARFWDVDGNEYIDWASGIGAIILGYADPVVDEAVTEQIGRGLATSINHPLEIELAEELAATIPCAEMVRYAKGGGEACALAVRIARGVTGRDVVLFCGYHGWHDWYLAANLAESSLDDHLLPGIEPMGVPSALTGTALGFRYGDAEHLAELLEAHAGKVAAVMLEPTRTVEPPPGYLATIAELARKNGAVLIFDEVSTGLRWSAGGAQQVLGVTPDVAVFAKSISNGFPMGLVVGKREVMAPAARMFLSSTYWSDPIGLCAALTTIREVKRRHVPAQLARFGATLKRRLDDIARETGAPVRSAGPDVYPHLTFGVADPEIRNRLTTLYIQEMARRGCHGYASFCLNAAQQDRELEQTEQALRETFTLLHDGLERGTIDTLLSCPPVTESFRRLVR